LDETTAPGDYASDVTSVTCARIFLDRRIFSERWPIVRRIMGTHVQMKQLPRQIRRVANGIRKYRAGLSLFGENISQVVPNDLYIAHLSIYQFFAGFCNGRSVLDLGCGAGYGCLYLADHGAREVVGIDFDPRNIEFAAKNSGRRLVTFLQGDIEALSRMDPLPLPLPAGRADPGHFDVVVSSNVFEHLVDVEAALDGVMESLTAGGDFLLAVPPIIGPESLRANQAIRYHRTNLDVAEWNRRLQGRFSAIRTFLHQPPEGSAPDFGDPFPSTLSAEGFRFVEAPPDEYYRQPSLTAIFACKVAP
jgi:SAM-dependent methyltransferase